MLLSTRILVSLLLFGQSVEDIFLRILPVQFAVDLPLVGQKGVLLRGKGEEHLVVLLDHLKVFIVGLFASTCFKIDIAVFDLLDDTQETELVTSGFLVFGLRLIPVLALDRIFCATAHNWAFFTLYGRL